MRPRHTPLLTPPPRPPPPLHVQRDPPARITSRHTLRCGSVLSAHHLFKACDTLLAHTNSRCPQLIQAHLTRAAWVQRTGCGPNKRWWVAAMRKALPSLPYQPLPHAYFPASAPLLPRPLDKKLASKQRQKRGTTDFKSQTARGHGHCRAHRHRICGEQAFCTSIHIHARIFHVSVCTSRLSFEPFLFYTISFCWGVHLK